MQIIPIDLVVAKAFPIIRHLIDEMDQIEGKRIVIVDNSDLCQLRLKLLIWPKIRYCGKTKANFSPSGAYNKNQMERTVINTENAPSPIGPYNQAIAHNGVLYVSGQIAINPNTGDLEMSDIKSETHRVLKNLHAVLDAGGSGLKKVLKTTIFLSDMKYYGDVNEVYGMYFDNDSAPAREAVHVSGLPKGVNVEISAIAVI